jgi:hypothetical protein
MCAERENLRSVAHTVSAVVSRSESAMDVALLEQG